MFMRHLQTMAQIRSRLIKTTAPFVNAHGTPHTVRIYSPLVQSVERVTVNHEVVGSSPTRGAMCTRF